jgi:hypothetical protein
LFRRGSVVAIEDTAGDVSGVHAEAIGIGGSR